MKTIFLLRHAKSSWKHPELRDHDRPLNKRGKRQAPEMGTRIHDEDLTPDLILSSTAKRARKTAVVVAENCGYDGKIDYIETFYPGGPAAYLRVLSELPDDVQRVMIVGHNPGLEDFLEGLVGESDLPAGLVAADSPTLPTAALAQVEIPLDAWRDLTAGTRGKLVKFLRPSA